MVLTAPRYQKIRIDYLCHGACQPFRLNRLVPWQIRHHDVILKTGPELPKAYCIQRYQHFIPLFSQTRIRIFWNICHAEESLMQMQVQMPKRFIATFCGWSNELCFGGFFEHLLSPQVNPFPNNSYDCALTKHRIGRSH